MRKPNILAVPVFVALLLGCDGPAAYEVNEQSSGDANETANASTVGAKGNQDSSAATAGTSDAGNLDNSKKKSSGKSNTTTKTGSSSGTSNAAGLPSENDSNQGIRITSVPITQVAANSKYSYKLIIQNPSSLSLVVGLATAPAGMTVTPVPTNTNEFLIEWSPLVADVGAHTVKVNATGTKDTFQSGASQSFSVRVEENCETGKLLAVWLVDETTLEKTEYLGFIQTYTDTTGQNLTAKQNYNYYSASAHPVNGPTPAGFQSHVFIYEDSSGSMFFNFYHNVDNGGSTNNRVNWDVATAGNNQADGIVIADEDDEFLLVSSADGKKYYEGRFQYWNNTDGAVIGPFTGTDFSILVRTTQDGDNIDGRFYSSDGVAHSLTSGQNISSFLLTYQEQRICSN